MVFGITHGAALAFFRLSNRPNEALGNWNSLMNSGSRNPTSSFMLSPVGRSPSSISSIMPKTLYAPLAADLDGMRTTFSTPSICGIPFAKVGVKIYPVFPRLRYQVSFSLFLIERHPASYLSPRELTGTDFSAISLLSGEIFFKLSIYTACNCSCLASLPTRVISLSI